MDLKNRKICVFGVQGSGKTVLVEYLLGFYKHPLIFSPNKDDYQKAASGRALVYRPVNYAAEFERVAGLVKQQAQAGKIDAFIVDEADLLFSSNYDLSAALNDLVVNHRHYGLALMFVSRRPQDVPSKIVESSHYRFWFPIDGWNVGERMKGEGIGDLMARLSYGDHRFIVKPLGQPAFIHAPIPQA